MISKTAVKIPKIVDIDCLSRDFKGTVGHTGISTGIGDTNNFDLFEQNDPGGGVCQKKTYNYQFVQGWMRPSLPAQPLIGTYVDKTTFVRVVNKSTQYELFVALGDKKAGEEMTKIKELTDKITELENR